MPGDNIDKGTTDIPPIHGVHDDTSCSTLLSSYLLSISCHLISRQILLIKYWKNAHL